MRRPLSPEDSALWARVSATVRAMPGRIATAVTPSAAAAAPTKKIAVPGVVARPVARPAPLRGPGETLDKAWDRRLATGAIIPDRTIDLHGHTLASAHAALDAGLDRAIRGGDRVVLLVTGRPPRGESERPHARGAIRAGIGDWLSLSRHASRIAAVRNAHPRHGGQGALYVVLRRAR
ncbi:DNA mismatch repair protein MutS [Sphingomonas sp. Leaf412]|uniref:Smr/MutS family protein n=1 Tax=Sphingomonas sp. Leaf412 TaxID=1736370 RepID=UPI0006FB929C|nr:Smr/MutS family protein [Sphingomonas sp. Leaf412]KQT32816.1 DNA mismatch repair protein MutS [Sphingomonas sp. Leaf412]